MFVVIKKKGKTMNLWQKIRMKLRLQQLNADEDILRAVKKGIEKIKVEKKEACSHQVLNQVIEGDLWYQCPKCKMVFFFPSGAGWEENQIPVLVKNLSDSLKIKIEKKGKK
jgi:hypothetical protein